jgi:transposase InsO family protein
MRNLTAEVLTTGIALPLVSVFETLALSRATYYRHLSSPVPADPDMELRDAIQRVALEWPQYGYRCITAQLHRQGVGANHKRVLRLMREDNLLCLRKRRFISTTNSSHSLKVYPNLVPELRLTAINQLWVADISVPQQAI